MQTLIWWSSVGYTMLHGRLGTGGVLMPRDWVELVLLRSPWSSRDSWKRGKKRNNEGRDAVFGGEEKGV